MVANKGGVNTEGAVNTRISLDEVVNNYAGVLPVNSIYSTLKVCQFLYGI